MQLVVVRVDEIGLKNKNKIFFMKKLAENIRKKLNKQYSFEISNNRIYIISDSEEINKKELGNLIKVFGIHSYSIVEKTDLELESIKKKVHEITKNALKTNNYKTFKVFVNRAYKSFPINSQELAPLLGEFILDNFPYLKVDLKHPELKVEIDIRRDGAYIFTDRFDGPSGLPVGVSSNGTVLLSGGIDSPVASILMMRRGMVLNAVNFYSPPFTGPKSLNKILRISSIISEYSPNNFYLYIIPLTKIQFLFKDLAEKRYSVILQRRSMLRIANKISEITGTKVLVSGESLGQVASQTVENLLTISDASKKEILRPLIGFTKNETIELSKKYGLYDTSILPYEDSCSIFLPPQPATKANVNKITLIEDSTPEISKLEKEALNESKKFEINNGSIREITDFKN
ncbi:tRNA uracil 4-sulfurtransferase ThiI [Petrotoga sp. 9PW.55.5.1]|uniref:tRNA uracil 4-sulfurtransferase ThiI n=1 Tax=Petrotoga sp. 9PW.55.5.1 TaxID=1308979 RepID=UPI000DD7F292|nr:tRNA uracil 4-sulfurtransferase ThiI [Petrotoga sp. 9PW.55.5.1]